MSAEAKQPFIDAMPDRHSGDLCFASTRVPVSTLFEFLAGGDSLGAFLAAFPSVDMEQARFVLGEANIELEFGEHGEEPLLPFATSAPNGGELCFAGTNVPVRDLFADLRQGRSLDGFFKRRPGVTREQAELALRKATAKLERNYGLPEQRMS